MVGATIGGLASALLADEAADQVFRGPRPALVAGMLGPRGTAVSTEAGYRVRGRYSFGSGAPHATWIAAGATVSRDGESVRRPDGSPEHLALVLPAAQVELTGNWDVYGLQGTGSVDYEVHDQEVAEAFTFSMADPRPRRGRGLYQLGVKGVAAAGHTAVALGIAKRALEEIAELAAKKARPGLARVVDQQLFLHDFAVHDAALRSARAYVWETYGGAEATADAGAVVTPEQHDRLRQACTYVHRVASDAVRFAYTWAGTTAMRRPNALGRCMRDISGATQHVYVDPNSLVAVAPALVAARTRSL
jgi:alkylation response protein AidB-like acyl-CoA dehydrogenase